MPSYMGAEQLFKVPSGVKSMTVVAEGAAGDLSLLTSRTRAHVGGGEVARRRGGRRFRAAPRLDAAPSHLPGCASRLRAISPWLLRSPQA
jgi:hypothetical protein